MVDSRWRNGNKTRQDAAAQLLLPQTHEERERAGGALVFFFLFYSEARHSKREAGVNRCRRYVETISSALTNNEVFRVLTRFAGEKKKGGGGEREREL